MPKLSEPQIQENFKNLSCWTLKGGQLHKSFSFKNFREAMAFVTKVALIAEPLDHHPDIDIRYNKVLLNLTTHSEGGLTAKDFNLAREIES